MNATTLALSRKQESNQILCRPQDDPFFHWIPACAGMGWETIS